MKINLDAKDYEVSNETLEKVLVYVVSEIEKVYNDLPVMVTTMVETFARKKLYDLERKSVEAGIPKELAAATYRPVAKQSPSGKMMEILSLAAKEIAKNVEIKLSSNNNGEIADLSYKYEDKSKAG